MTEAETRESLLRSLRDPAPLTEARDARWRRAGLAAGGAMLLVIAWATLSPAPVSVARTPGLDKVAHFLGFALLIFPVVVTDTRRWGWAVPLAILLGGLIELVQPTVGRSAEWLDWGADISGVLAGAALAELLHDRLRAGLMGETPSDSPLAEESLGEIRRAELIEDLRIVLREELAAINRPGADPGALAQGSDARERDLRH